MAKKTVTSPISSDEAVMSNVYIEPSYTHKAFSMAIHNNQWGVVEISYNLDGQTGNYTFYPCGNDKSEAIEAYKIRVAQNLFN